MRENFCTFATHTAQTSKQKMEDDDEATEGYGTQDYAMDKSDAQMRSSQITIIGVLIFALIAGIVWLVNRLRKWLHPKTKPK